MPGPLLVTLVVSLATITAPKSTAKADFGCETDLSDLNGSVLSWTDGRLEVSLRCLSSNDGSALVDSQAVVFSNGSNSSRALHPLHGVPHSPDQEKQSLNLNTTFGVDCGAVRLASSHQSNESKFWNSLEGERRRNGPLPTSSIQEQVNAPLQHNNNNPMALLKIFEGSGQHANALTALLVL